MGQIPRSCLAFARIKVWMAPYIGDEKRAGGVFFFPRIRPNVPRRSTLRISDLALDDKAVPNSLFLGLRISVTLKK